MERNGRSKLKFCVIIRHIKAGRSQFAFHLGDLSITDCNRNRLIYGRSHPKRGEYRLIQIFVRLIAYDFIDAVPDLLYRKRGSIHSKPY